MNLRVVILSLIAGLTCNVETFTIGAPDMACKTMTPGHAHKIQTSESPAEIIVDVTEVKPGQTIDFKLKGKDGQKFMGFIIQVRDAKNLDNQVGSFIAGDEAKYMTCGRGIHNSLTHRGSTLKDEIASKWRAPSDFNGEVVFMFTNLIDYTTYWVRTQGPRLQIGQAEPEISEVKTTKAEETTTTTEYTLADFVVDEIEEEFEKILEETHLHNLNDKDDTTGGHTHNILDAITATKTKIGNLEVIEDNEEIVLQDLDFPQPSLKAENELNLAAARPQDINVEDAFEPIYISSTTTLKTTTRSQETTPDPLPYIDGVAQHTSLQDPIYEGCNSTKACFGIPENCVASRKCQAVVAYKLDKVRYHFEMKALSEGYVAFGLSRDDKMGGDLTTNCIVQENGNVDISTGYNYGKSHKPPKVSRKEDGIKERMQSGRRDGWIYCSWTRNISVYIENEIWDFEKDIYHVMLAVGDVYDNAPQFHSSKVVSGEPMGLGQVGLIKAKSRLYIILHGSFMIGAWMFASTLGIIFARYFKQTWTNTKVCGLDQWFVWHRSLMFLVWCLSIVGLVLIILDVEGITPTIMTNPHAIMGFVTVGLTFIQPFLALLRCSPTHRNRWMFNWVHWFIGNAAQILGVACIFFATSLEKAQLPPETDFLIIAWVAFHILTHVIMSIVSCVGENKAAKHGTMKYPPRGPYHPQRGPHQFPDYEELKRDHPGAGIRKFGLAAYTVVCFIAAALLIALIVMAPTRPTLVNIGILS